MLNLNVSKFHTIYSQNNEGHFLSFPASQIDSVIIPWEIRSNHLFLFCSFVKNSSKIFSEWLQEYLEVSPDRFYLKLWFFCGGLQNSTCFSLQVHEVLIEKSDLLKDFSCIWYRSSESRMSHRHFLFMILPLNLVFNVLNFLKWSNSAPLIQQFVPHRA